MAVLQIVQCTSVLQIDVFTQQHSTDPSRPGVHLSLPTALHGKHAKVGTAPDGGTVNVWDIAVHPAALAEAAKRTGFMDTLVTIVSSSHRLQQVAANYY